MVVADLQSSHPCIRHVAICTSNTRTSVHPLVPKFEFRVSRFNHGGTCVRMFPLFHLVRVFVGDDAIDTQALAPRERKLLFWSLEVVGHVALAANE